MNGIIAARVFSKVSSMSVTKFHIGQQARSRIRLDQKFIESFAELSGDRNPLHMDPEFAKRTKFRRVVAHGSSYAAIVSRIIGMELPGPGALWLSQNFEFRLPVFLGDEIEIVATVAQLSQSTNTMDLFVSATNQNGETVLEGNARVQVLDVADADETEDNTPPNDRTALVIGGSRGIGASTAKRLVDDGFGVAFTYRQSRDDAEALVGLNNEALLGIQADIADDECAAKTFDAIVGKFGRPPDTIVFCASAPITYVDALETDYSQYDRQLAISLRGTHAVLNRFLPHMKSLGFGRLIAISSSYTLANPPEKMAPYIVAKSALNALMKCVAIEYARFGIRANLIAPSMTETAMLAKVPERQVKVAAAKNPSRRLGKPEDIAGAVSFLASLDADYVNGETLVISGGELIR